MKLDPHLCPADRKEVAEAYCMGTLDAADAAAFEEHCLACSICLAILESTEQYVSAMGAAARRLRSARRNGASVAGV